MSGFLAAFYVSCTDGTPNHFHSQTWVLPFLALVLQAGEPSVGLGPLAPLVSLCSCDVSPDSLLPALFCIFRPSYQYWQDFFFIFLVMGLLFNYSADGSSDLLFYNLIVHFEVIMGRGFHSIYLLCHLYRYANVNILHSHGTIAKTKKLSLVPHY